MVLKFLNRLIWFKMCKNIKYVIKINYITDSSLITKIIIIILKFTVIVNSQEILIEPRFFCSAS